MNILLRLAACAAIAGISAAAVLTNSSANRNAAIMNDIATVTKLTGLTDLQDGRLLHFAHDSAGEQSLRVKLVMPEPAFARFLAANQLRREEFRAANHGLLGTDEGDWDPRAHTAFPVVMRQRAKGQFLHIGFRPADGGQIVYLYWFMT